MVQCLALWPVRLDAGRRRFRASLCKRLHPVQIRHLCTCNKQRPPSTLRLRLCQPIRPLLLLRLRRLCPCRAQLPWNLCLRAHAGLVRLCLRLRTYLQMFLLWILPDVSIAVAPVQGPSAACRVTIRAVQTPVRGSMTPPGAAGTGTMPAMPATRGDGEVINHLFENHSCP